MDARKEIRDELDMDLFRLFGALMKRAWIIGLAAALCAGAAFLAAHFLVMPRYQSSATFYIHNSAVSRQEPSSNISAEDISASRSLVKSCVALLGTRGILEDVAACAGVDRGWEEMGEMIQAESVDGTEILRVVVTSPDPQEAEQIANAVAEILPQRVSGILEGSSAKIVDFAVVPSVPSSPDKIKICAAGFGLGLLLSAGAAIVRISKDDTLYGEAELSRCCPYPVLASIPRMERGGKDGENTVPVGHSVTGEGLESYKILRTKLGAAIGASEKCRVIGISGIRTGEGRSVSAVNLACALSELDRRVLLIECDMRRPSLGERLPVQGHPGLSEYLSGQASGENLLRHCGMEGRTGAFHVIPAGHTPSNPVELLSSGKMERMMGYLKNSYDDIILDLPPVGDVSDALSAAALTDGLLLVVRQGHGSRTALEEAIRQLEFVDARILGVVFNCANKGAWPWNR